MFCFQESSGATEVFLKLYTKGNALLVWKKGTYARNK